jgi:hypothetical protein
MVTFRTHWFSVVTSAGLCKSGLVFCFSMYTALHVIAYWDIFSFSFCLHVELGVVFFFNFLIFEVFFFWWPWAVGGSMKEGRIICTIKSQKKLISPLDSMTVYSGSIGFLLRYSLDYPD